MTVLADIVTYWGHGFGGDLVALMGGPIQTLEGVGGLGILTMGYRKLNCGAPRCWRIGHHPTADRLHHLCGKHHPDLPGRKLSLKEIHGRHHRARL